MVKKTMYLAVWQVLYRPPNAKLFLLGVTADKYETHLRESFGDKLVHWKVSKVKV